MPTVTPARTPPRTGAEAPVSSARAYAVTPGFTGSRKPGVILAAQVMLGVSIASNLLVLTISTVTLALAGPAGTTLTTTRASKGPSLAFVEVLGLLALLISTLVKFSAQRGISRRRRSSRTVIAVLPGFELAALLIFSLLIRASVLAAFIPVLLGLPWTVVIVLLLRVPAEACRWFDHSGPASYRLGQPRQSSTPADDGDRWAAERRRAREQRGTSRPAPTQRPTVAEAVAMRPDSKPPTPSAEVRRAEDEQLSSD